MSKVDNLKQWVDQHLEDEAAIVASRSPSHREQRWLAILEEIAAQPEPRRSELLETAAEILMHEHDAQARRQQ